MSSSGSISVRVQVDIQMPDGFGAAEGSRSVVRTFDSNQKLQISFLNSDPYPGESKLVRLNGSGLGCICAWVRYAIPVQAVNALAMPAANFNPPLADSPPQGITGVPLLSGTVWQWSDDNMVPGADHSPAGRPNVFTVWYQDTDGNWHWDPSSVNFTGIDALYGPCPPLPFSGLGKATGNLAAQPSIFVGEATGFGGESTIFNTLIALQKNGPSTWHNKGDGKSNPEIILTHDCRQKAWHLSLHYRSIRVVVSANAGLTLEQLIFNAEGGGRVRIAPHL